MRTSDRNIDRIYISSAQRSVEYHMIENHSHFYYEIYYVRHGKCHMYLENAIYTMEEGDIMIIPPGINHFTRYLSKCTRINIYFKPSDLQEAAGDLFFSGLTDYMDKITVLHIPGAYINRIHPIIDNMIAEEKVDDTSTPMIQNLSLRQFLLYLYRYGIPYSSPDVNQSDLEIINAVNYINEHYSSPITLDDLADMAGLSTTYFSKKFRNVTGSGMKEYLSYVRLNHAAMELQSTQNTITEIALSCGFSNSNYFKDSFKKMYGISPREYRKQRDTDWVKEHVENEALQNQDAGRIMD